MDEDGKKKSQGKKKFTSGKTTELEQKSVESLSTTTEVPPTPAEVPERNMRYENADELGQSPKGWTESQVSTWLRSFGVKEQYIEKIYEEEVDGQILLALDEDYLKSKICMKSGPALLIIQKRNELISSKQTSKEDCRPRPFDQDVIDFKYVKHDVLPPESGALDLISPCREFKSFAVAAALDPTRLQAKTAKEVLKFAAGCMNIRTNGTIHLGVMDSRDDAGYVHGEIIGIPVKKKDIYVDALDYIERSFSSNKEHVRQCVRPPRFIEVMDRESTEKRLLN